jgi:hypothetical protein
MERWGPVAAGVVGGIVAWALGFGRIVGFLIAMTIMAVWFFAPYQIRRLYQHWRKPHA